MVPPGTYMIFPNKTVNRKSWVHNGTPGWYIVPSLDHYRFMKCYKSATGIVIITDTLQYILKTFDSPWTTTEDYLKQAIGDIISIIKYRLKKLPFLSYGDKTKI